MNILITGGASGLGEAITRRLAKNSDNHIFYTYNKSEENAKLIGKDLNNTTSIKCDFRNSNEVTLFCENVKQFDIDVLINNAYSGDFLKTNFHKIPANEFLDDFKENVLPVIEITQTFITEFRKKKSGKIITILTSALFNVPPIGSSVYVANKAYLEKLTKVWASENIKFNISSNTISPSLMQTSLTSCLDERLIEQFKEANPLKQILTVDEVAESVEFLVRASKHINGFDIMLNTGVSLK